MFVHTRQNKVITYFAVILMLSFCEIQVYFNSTTICEKSLA
jgi:hypothetical protein